MGARPDRARSGDRHGLTSPADLSLTTIETVRRQQILDAADRMAKGWASGTDTVIVSTSFDGEELDVTVFGPGELPPGDLADSLAGAVPTGTPLVVNHVTGERVEVGKVPAPNG